MINEDQEIKVDSLIGRFFHGDDKNQWQGMVIAEPVKGTYLVELFSWLTGEATNQQLIEIKAMFGWRFYDTVEWMNNAYTHGLKQHWQSLRDKAAEDDFNE